MNELMRKCEIIANNKKIDRNVIKVFPDRQDTEEPLPHDILQSNNIETVQKESVKQNE